MQPEVAWCVAIKQKYGCLHVNKQNYNANCKQILTSVSQLNKMGFNYEGLLSCESKLTKTKLSKENYLCPSKGPAWKG